MKKRILLLILIIQGIVFAQIPHVTFKDFDYQKQVLKVETIKYDFEDNVVREDRIEIQNFNSLGNAEDIKTTYFSNKMVIEKKYMYKNNLLVETIDSNSNRKNFTTYTNFSYTLENQIDLILTKTNDFKTIFSITYNGKKNKQIDEIFGKFGANYQYDKFYYNLNNKLWVRDLNVYVSDTISMNSKELFIDDKSVANCISNNNTIVFNTRSKNASEVIELNLKPNRVHNEFLNLSDIVKEKKMNQEEYRTLILSLNDIKIKTQNYYLLNEHNDWIVQCSFKPSNPKKKQYYFRKITYSDGTISGSNEFSISTINEFNSLLK